MEAAVTASAVRKYGVFSDEGCSQKVGELVTDKAEIPRNWC